MIFQWYLFVLMLILALFAVPARLAWEEDYYGERIIHCGWFVVLIMVIPMIYLAMNRSSQFGDTSAYMSMFKGYASNLGGAITALKTSDIKDRGFTIVSILIKTAIGDRVKVWLAIIASVCLISVAYGFKNYSCNFIMSMFLFVASGDYVQWCYNGIREFIAASVLFAAMGLLLRKKYVPYIVLILFLSTIHLTALIMIPVIFIVQGQAWNKRTVLFLMAVIVAVLFLERTTNIITTVMENTQYSNEVGQYLETSGTSIFRVIVYSIPALLSLRCLGVVRNINNPIINLSIGMSIAAMGFYIVSAFTSGIFVGRIPIYFSLYNYILLPWEIENIFEKRSATIVYSLMIILYMLFYYYQIHITWGL